MICLLAASVVGSWTYAGFLDRPNPAPKSTRASAPEIPAVGATWAAKPEPEPEPQAPASKPTEADPPTIPPLASPIPPRPTLYRSTDASGQTWEHPDRSYLASFVEARNRSFANVIYTSPQPARASRCYNGRCN